MRAIRLVEAGHTEFHGLLFLIKRLSLACRGMSGFYHSTAVGGYYDTPGLAIDR